MIQIYRDTTFSSALFYILGLTCFLLVKTTFSISYPIKLNCGEEIIPFQGWINDSAFLENSDSCLSISYEHSMSSERCLDEIPLIIYSTARILKDKSDSIKYSFNNLENGMYNIRLHFASYSVNHQSLDVFIESKKVMDNFTFFKSRKERNENDIVIYEFTSSVRDSNGLQIYLTNQISNHVLICGIEIIPWNVQGPIKTELSFIPTHIQKGNNKLCGNVLDFKNEPVSNTVITAMHWKNIKNVNDTLPGNPFNATYTTTSDSTGNYCLSNLIKGDYFLSVSKGEVSRAITWMLSIPQNTSLLTKNITLSPGFPVQGIVTDKHNKPLENCQIHFLVYPSDFHADLPKSMLEHPFPYEQLTSDKSGKFSSTTIPKKVPFLVVVQKKNYLTYRKYFSGLPKTPIKINLVKPASINFSIIDMNSGKPITNAYVNCGKSTMNTIYCNKTDNKGNSTIVQLPPKRLSVKVCAEGYLTEKKRIKLRSETPLNLTMKLKKGLSLFGRIVSVPGDSIPIPNVVIFLRINKITFSAKTDKEGSFEIHGLPESGIAYIKVRKEGYSQVQKKPIILKIDNNNNTVENPFIICMYSKATISAVIETPNDIDGKEAIIYLKNKYRGFYTITLREKIQGKTIMPVLIDPGVYTVSVHIQGYKPSADTVIKSLPGTNSEVKFTLESGHSISGYVKNHNDLPISGVKVICFRKPNHYYLPRIYRYDFPPKGASKSISDSTGYFKLAGLKNNAHVIQFTHEMCHSEVRVISIQTDIDTLSQILYPGTKVSGIVTDIWDKPIANVECRMIPKSSDHGMDYRYKYSRTNERGEYEIADLNKGEYKLIIDNDDYIRETQIITINEGEHIENADFQLKSGYCIEGKVVRNGWPVPKQSVFVQAQIYNNDEYRRMVMTDEDGNFTIKGLKNHEYNLSVPSTNLHSVYPYNKIILAPKSGVIIELPDIITYKVVGQVNDPMGNPVPMFHVAIGDQEFENQYNGTFEIIVNKTGVFQLSIRADGFAEYTTELFQISNENREKYFDIQLKKSISIRGKVVDQNGKPIPGALITDRKSINKESKGDGSFVLDKLTQKNKKIYISHDKFLPTVDTINSTSGKTKNLIITLFQGGSVEGTVYDSNNNPCQNISVIGEMGQNDVTDRKGYYFLSKLKPGKQTISIWTKNVSKSVEIKRGKTARLDFLVNTNTDSDMGSLEGTISRNNAPINDCKVMLLGSGPKYFLPVTVNLKNGYFKFEKVSPGEYRIFVRATTGEIICPENYTIKKGEEKIVAIDLPTIEISGRIIDDSNNPLSSVTFSVMEGASQKFLGSCLTGNDGRFIFIGMNSGEFVGKIYKMFNNSAEKNIIFKINPNENKDLGDIVVDKGYELYGKVQSQTGAKLNGELMFYDITTGVYSYFTQIKNGEYKSHPLQPVEYMVLVCVDDHFISPKKVNLEKSAKIDFFVSPCPRISVQIQDKNGLPIHKANATIKKKMNGSSAPFLINHYSSTSISDDSGKITIKRRYQGDQTIAISHKDYLDTLVNITLPNQDEKKLTITLKKKD